MLNAKNLGLVDVILGVVSFAFQIAVVACCSSHCTTNENASTGIWGGAIFVVTGLWAFKFGIAKKAVMLGLSGLSLTCGIILLVLSSAAVDHWNNSYNYNDTQLGLNAILIICGILASVINAILGFLSLKS